MNLMNDNKVYKDKVLPLRNISVVGIKCIYDITSKSVHETNNHLFFFFKHRQELYFENVTAQNICYRLTPLCAHKHC